MMHGTAALTLLVLSSLIVPVYGFGPSGSKRDRHPFVVLSATSQSSSSSSSVAGGEFSSSPLHISYDPAHKLGVDMARAHACADHFGQCTVDEMQELRDSYVQRIDLHKERLQRFMFGSSATADASAASLDTIRGLEDSLEHRLLEEELDLQLSMLRDQNEVASRSSNLFPEVEEPMEELPHLKDRTHYEHDKKAVEKAELALALEETVLEESNLEAIALCACIAAMLLFPTLLQL